MFVAAEAWPVSAESFPFFVSLFVCFLKAIRTPLGGDPGLGSHMPERVSRDFQILPRASLCAADIGDHDLRAPRMLLSLINQGPMNRGKKIINPQAALNDHHIKFALC